MPRQERVLAEDRRHPFAAAPDRRHQRGRRRSELANDSFQERRERCVNLNDFSLLDNNVCYLGKDIFELRGTKNF